MFDADMLKNKNKKANANLEWSIQNSNTDNQKKGESITPIVPF